MSDAPPFLSRALTLTLATAVGIIAANLYYAQPLVAQISHALGLTPGAAGLVVTLTQVGYGLGVLLVVPLGDVLENRRLVLTMLACTVLGLVGLAFVTSLTPYFLAAFVTGVGCSALQIIVPYVAHLTSERNRGHVVGTLMSGVMLGIMLSRPAASLLTDIFSWHAVFVLSAGLMCLLALVLYRTLPARQPPPLGLRYLQLVRSMGTLFKNTEILRRRAFYQACLFGAFCLFWTACPLLLAGPEFHFSQTGIALFALAGVAGAISAPYAGKAADRGLSTQATMAAMFASSFSFLLGHIFPLGSVASVATLLFSAILLDAGISANLVLGQRAIFSLAPEHRSRLNGLYIAIIFVGGAVGSALGAWAFARGGWNLTTWCGFALPVCAFLYFLTEPGPRRLRLKRER